MNNRTIIYFDNGPKDGFIVVEPPVDVRAKLDAVGPGEWVEFEMGEDQYFAVIKSSVTAVSNILPEG